ncbi:hypothetical protein Nmel_006202 [Mimus melanotis]
MQCKRIPDVSLTFCCVKELFILIAIPFLLSSIFYCSLICILNVLVLELLVPKLLIVIVIRLKCSESYMPGYCDM